MSEDLNTTEIENELPEVENSESTETTEQPEKIIERPWKKKEEVEEAHIPYNRFKEVNDERKAYREKIEQYERELAQLKTPVKEKTVEERIEELDPNTFNTVGEYLQAREKLILENAEKNFMDRMESMRREKEDREYQEQLTNSFRSNITEAITRNPEVADAVNYLDQFAERIPVQVRHALITDENAGDLCFEIATNPKFLEQVVQGNVVDSIRMMAKWSAKFEKGSVVPKSKEPEAKLEDIKAMIPKTVKGSTTNKKDPNKMSMSEFRAWRNGK